MSNRILASCSSMLAVLLSAAVAAQQAVLTGIVLDAATGAALPGAHAVLQGSARVAVSDAEGRFTLNVRPDADAVIRISHAGYAELKRMVLAREIATGEPLLLRLRREAIALGEAVVRARPEPEVVFQRPDLHVGGYLANDEGLWVLAYDKAQLWHAQQDVGRRVMQAPRLVLLDTLLRERATTPLHSDARAMHREHGGRPIVEGAREGWVARMDHGGILLGRVDRETLRAAVLPWTDSLRGRLLGNNRSETYPAFEHFARELKTGKDRLLCAVQDVFMMELFRSQYKYMSGPDKVVAMDLELETGIDREIIAGFMTGFHKDLYFKVPYAPLFVVRDTLCVFDHALGRIRWFSHEGLPLGEARMRHTADRHWSGLLLQDRGTGQVHAVFRQGPRTWLRSIAAGDGALGEPVRLTHPFPEDLQVHDGHVYYVHRPHGSMQKRTLYREALR